MKKSIRIILLTILSFIMMTIFLNADAASASISASKTNATVGDTITISVSMNAAAWNTKLTGAVTKNFAGNSDDGENMNKVETATFTPTAAGTYTINLGGDVSDGTTNATTNVGGKVTITVAEKQQPAQTTTQQTTQTQTNTQQQTPAQPAATYTNTNQTLYVKNNGTNVRKEAVSGSIITSLKAGTSVQVTGTGSNGWSRVSVNGQTGYIRSDLLTSTKPAEEQKEEEKQEEKKEETTDKSTNKALKDLVVENYKLSPDFTPETTKYSLDVKGDVDKLEITPVLQDEKSKFTIEGNDNLKVGNNIVKITVTAEDGTTRIYTIAVAKTNADGTPAEMLQLKDLKVNNANLNPTFSSEITNYTVEVEDPSSIKASDIVATAADENVEVNVSESVNTDKSEKIFTIVLEDKEGTKTGVYQITVKKASMNPITAIKNNKDNKLYYILGGIIGILLILIVIILIMIKKTADEEDAEEDMDDENTTDNYDYSLKNAIDEANAEPENIEEDLNETFNNAANIKSQILNSTAKEYDVFKDNDDFEKTQVFDNLDSEIKEKRKGKHF